MRQYIATVDVSAAGVVTEVQTLTGLATMLQVATPATTGIKLLGWGISFKGVVASDLPILCYLLDGDVGMSNAASLTPDGLNSQGKAVASLCVGGTGATAISDGSVTEGTITASTIIDPQYVHPQSGYGIWWPQDARPEVAASRFLRARVNAAVDIKCIPWIAWSE